jgi:hypothetical protein
MFDQMVTAVFRMTARVDKNQELYIAFPKSITRTEAEATCKAMFNSLNLRADSLNI